jgi:ubiquinone/menaquinone biosynthesis C-methylase UbiE
VGCSWGNETFFFAEKCEEAYGIDVSEKFIAKAKKKYPGINFFVAQAERMPFQDCFFDVVVMSEVLEHVTDEVASLSEAYRVLAPDGEMILTVPHKGLFGFLDPANQKFYLKKIMPGLFNAFVGRKIKKDPDYASVLSQGMHRHYSSEDLENLLNQSNWKGRYRIEEIKRHDLFIGPLANLIGAFAKNIFGKKLSKPLIAPLVFLSRVESRVSFGRCSYQMEMLIRKTADLQQR